MLLNRSSDVQHVSILVDWKSAAHGLRPRKSTTGGWQGDVSAARTVLQKLRKAITAISMRHRAYFVDTLLFGGFVGPDGSWTEPKQVLDHAVSNLRWPGASKSGLHLRHPVVVHSFRPGRLTEKIRGLYRPSEPVQVAHIQQGHTSCDCGWAQLTEEWLSAEYGMRRSCPKCKRKLVLARPQQKLVDSLLISYAFDRARLIVLENASDSEIWICSTDADFVPALAMISSWGIHCRWLQPAKNNGFGYSDYLRSCGVDIHLITELLRGTDGK